jgi:hypothetical protein
MSKQLKIILITLGVILLIGLISFGKIITGAGGKPAKEKIRPYSQSSGNR